MYVQRAINKKFQKLQEVYAIIAIVGARQSGKTTFLRENMPANGTYLTFDDPDIRNLFEEDIKKFEKQYLRDLSVLDEVDCPDAGRKLKYLADKDKQLWITSSSEMILGKEVLSHLVGRVSILKLYPFSLDEFKEAKSIKEMTDTVRKRTIWEHLTYGGYPKVILTEDFELKKTILHDLYETMILKDIAKTFSITDFKSLEQVSRYFAANVGGVLSYDKVSKIVNISFQTIKKYLDAMEKSYLLVRIGPFYKNKNKEIAKQPKVYFIDTGLRNSIARDFSSEFSGNLFENYVLSELLKAGFQPKYWRTKAGAEVDFVVEKEGGIIPIEVKLSERIEKSLHSFIAEYKPEQAFIVQYTGEERQKIIQGCKIIITDVVGLLKRL